jgi:hypothetical protein
MGDSLTLVFDKADLACGKVIIEWGSPYHWVTRPTPSP